MFLEVRQEPLRLEPLRFSVLRRRVIQMQIHLDDLQRCMFRFHTRRVHAQPHVNETFDGDGCFDFARL